MRALADLNLADAEMALGRRPKLKGYGRDPAFGVAVAHLAALAATHQLKPGQRREVYLDRFRRLAGDPYRQLNHVAHDHMIPIHRAHDLRRGMLLDQGDGQEEVDHQSFTACTLVLLRAMCRSRVLRSSRSTEPRISSACDWERLGRSPPPLWPDFGGGGCCPPWGGG